MKHQELGDRLKGQFKGIEELGGFEKLVADTRDNGFGDWIEEGLLDLSKTPALYRYGDHVYDLCERFKKNLHYIGSHNDYGLGIETRILKKLLFESALYALEKYEDVIFGKRGGLIDIIMYTTPFALIHPKGSYVIGYPSVVLPGDDELETTLAKRLDWIIESVIVCTKANDDPSVYKLVVWDRSKSYKIITDEKESLIHSTFQAIKKRLGETREEFLKGEISEWMI